VTQYWNWIVDYFYVLFRNRPLPPSLEDLPARAFRRLAGSLTTKQFRYALAGVIGLAGLFWLHSQGVQGAGERLLLMTEAGAAGVFVIYHTVSPRSRLYGETWSRGNAQGGPGERVLILTFDDGPNEPFTSSVLDILKRKGVRATFFPVGENVRRYPEVCRRIIVEGHEVGNHSLSHRRGLCLSGTGTIRKEVSAAGTLISKATGTVPTLFRPPHGFRTPWMMRTLRSMGYTVVTWNNMTDDWEEDKPSEDIITAIMKKAVPGGIIVLHDGRSTRHGYDRTMMLKALPEIIDRLARQGYRFVTVSELIESERADKQRRNGSTHEA
jgi:peptidoglycan/xylan/chitin deacetylase (PgdA/CDA1 family)